MTSSSLQKSLETAIALYRSGDLDGAGHICASILDDTPDEANALHILGAIRLRQNDAQGAVDLLGRALRRDPRNAEVMTNLGAAHRAAGSTVKAIDVLKKAVRLAPRSPAAHFNYANALTAAGSLSTAERHYRRALQIDAHHAGARRALAALLLDAGRAAEALAEYEAFDAAFPGDAAALNAIGALRAEAGDFSGAETALRGALAAAPEHLDAAANLANVLACQWHHDEALSLYNAVLSVSPDSADMLSNMGNVCRRAGDLDKAQDYFTRALQRVPDHVDAGTGLSACHLARGRYTDGWRHYLNRDSVGKIASPIWRFPFPDRMDGRHVAIVADQGLGDEIFFLRFARPLRERGATLSYRPEPRLLPILSRADVVDRMLPSDAVPTDADYTVAVGDLPYLLGMADGDDVPPPILLRPDPKRVAALRERLEAAGPRPWIGVTWRAGNANRRRLLFKEAPADGLADALAAASDGPDAEGTVVAVQRGESRDGISAFASRLGRPVTDFSDANDDIEDLLALSSLLDVYIGVSNTMVHLRAACGGRTHVLVPVPAEFRWMAAGDESPWFPGSPVYRQTADGDWNAAFTRLSTALRA